MVAYLLNGFHVNRVFSKLMNCKYISSFSFAKRLNADINPCPNVIKLIILGNGSKGNPRAVILSTDHRNYLFNCGEGTQRVAFEYKLDLNKLRHLFFTSRSYENISGLIGLFLTCYNQGVETLTLHGPNDISKILDIYKNFMIIGKMKVKERTLCEKSHSDYVMNVDYVPIYKSYDVQTEESKVKNCDYNSTDICFAYICKMKDKPGRLCIKKCVELKIPPGPIIKELMSGHDAILPDNRVIKSSDVVGPEEKGRILIVLECASVDHIDSLIMNDEFKKYQQESNENSKLLCSIVHFSPSHVINDHRYKDWISKFNPHVVHLICNEDSPSLSLCAIYQLQTRLNLIDPYIFPLLPHPNYNHEYYNYKQNNIQIINSPTFLNYYIRNKTDYLGTDSSEIVEIDNQAIKNEALSNEKFFSKLKNYHSQVEDILSKTNHKTIDYPELIFLGTGGSISSAARNVSAILVNITEDTSILLDCGENTYGQLYRFYGDQFEDQLTKIKAIYVSHFHEDHHLGLLSIIKKRSTLNNEPIFLIIPPYVEFWLEPFHEILNPISHLYKIVPCSSFMKNHNVNYNENEDILNLLKLKQIQTEYVTHCEGAFGISMTTLQEPSYKIVYSGDTIPDESLVNLGKNCNLLIHEATFDDCLIDEARLKQHSTISEAIDIGNRMNAEFTILTHFSQRYEKLPILNEKFNEKVGIAFDNMRVRMSDLKKLPLMLPVIKSLFHEEYEQTQNRILVKHKRNLLINEILREISVTN